MPVLPTKTMLLATALVAGASTAAMAQTVYGGGSTLAQAVYNSQFNLYENANVNALFNYGGVGSGMGMAAFLGNVPADDGFPSGTDITFGASDATLSSAQISGFNTTTNGNLIQLPSFGTPITIPFKISGKTGNGALALTDADVCGVFSGKLTDFSQLSSPGGLSGAIYVAYRSDGSGTSFLLTQHLAAVCTSSTSNVTFSAMTTFADEFPSDTPPLNFHGAKGSSGVLGEITGNANAVGYLTPDVTHISPINSGSSSAPYVASVNGILPTSAQTAKALSNAPAPTTQAQLSSPAAYVPADASPSSGYPIVGFTTLEFAQCYASANVANLLADFILQLYTSAPYTSVITANGFSAVPSGFSNAIIGNIYNNNNGYNLDIQDPTGCSGKAGR